MVYFTAALVLNTQLVHLCTLSQHITDISQLSATGTQGHTHTNQVTSKDHEKLLLKKFSGIHKMIALILKQICQLWLKCTHLFSIETPINNVMFDAEQAPMFSLLLLNF